MSSIFWVSSMATLSQKQECEFWCSAWSLKHCHCVRKALPLYCLYQHSHMSVLPSDKWQGGEGQWIIFGLNSLIGKWSSSNQHLGLSLPDHPALMNSDGFYVANSCMVRQNGKNNCCLPIYYKDPKQLNPNHHIWKYIHHTGKNLGPPFI